MCDDRSAHHFILHNSEAFIKTGKSGGGDSWEGCRDSRKCARNALHESYITKYTNKRRKTAAFAKQGGAVCVTSPPDCLRPGWTLAERARLGARNGSYRCRVNMALVRQSRQPCPNIGATHTNTGARYVLHRYPGRDATCF